jgi:xanthine phosphoribosyltransferase
MQALREAIAEMGTGFGKDIVQVGRFLNHRIETGLLFKMGREIAAYFMDEQPDLVMTVEASGIALAVCTAHALGDIPVLFAKKSPARNQDEALLSVPVSSYTHGTVYQMRCSRNCLPPGSRVLIVDDFLADGEAARGMMDLVAQAGATTIGVGIAIEKGFQDGGRLLREQGVKLLSLSVVREIRDGDILLQND